MAHLERLPTDDSTLFATTSAPSVDGKGVEQEDRKIPADP
jgi:hypothetical protein